MAIKEMTPVKGILNKFTEFAFEVASSTTEGFKFALPRMSDEYVIVLVQNTGSGAATITVKKPGKGSYAASGSDETHELGAGEFAILRFESAKWCNNDSTITLVPNNVAVKVAVLY